MKNGTIHVLDRERKSGTMQNSPAMTENIRNEKDLVNAREALKTIYREIIKLVIKKEEYEEKIEEYLRKK